MPLIDRAPVELSASLQGVCYPNFDLTHIMKRVARNHPDWSAERLTLAESDYRFFLAKVKEDESGKHSPSPDVDEVWHAHILFTRQYASDCSSYFGYFVHHVPTVDGDCGECCSGDDCGADGDCKTQCYLRPGKCNVEPN